MKYTIDAKDRVLGRVATEAAHILRGKNTPDFEPNKIPHHTVTIVNAAAVRITGSAKPLQKIYKRFSGYPSGLKKTSYEKVFAKDPRKVIEHAVRGMLPKNKLAKRILRSNLVIYKHEKEEQ